MVSPEINARALAATLPSAKLTALRVIAGSVVAIWSYVATAQPAPPAAPQISNGPGELVDAGQRFLAASRRVCRGD
jgi:hypothetical protein